MTVEISDLKHLEKVIKSLRAVDGVLDVERTGGPARRRRSRLSYRSRYGVAAMASISIRASLGSRAA